MTPRTTPTDTELQEQLDTARAAEADARVEWRAARLHEMDTRAKLQKALVALVNAEEALTRRRVGLPVRRSHYRRKGQTDMKIPPSR